MCATPPAARWAFPLQSAGAPIGPPEIKDAMRRGVVPRGEILVRARLSADMPNGLIAAVIGSIHAGPTAPTKAAGVCPIRVGIFLVPEVERRRITPPVARNLFVLHSSTGRGIFGAARVALPFFRVLATALLALFPEIALWLPGTMLPR